LIEKNERPKKALFEELADAKINAIQSELIISKKSLELLDERLVSKTLKNKLYIISIGLLLIIFLMYIVIYRTQQKKNKAISELKTELLTVDLNSKKSDLYTFGLNLKYKRIFIDNIQKKLKKVQRSNPARLKEELSSLIIEFNNYMHMDKNVEVLQKDIDKVNTFFFKKLSEKHPTLTKKEKEICGLLLLKLPSKDIATIRNISPHSVKKTRQRIRKKLPIGKMDNLSEFLESIT